MSNIQSIEAMRLYIKQQLGYPTINVELTDEQLDISIEDSIQFYNDENYGEGSYRTYLTFNATSGVDEYVLSGDNIQDVFDFSFQSSNGGINTLFSPANTLLYNDWVLKGNYPSGGGSCQGQELTSYQIAMGHLQDIKNMFEKKYRVDWWSQKQTLKITPTPNEDLTGVLLIYKKSELVDLLNNRWVKRLSVAKAKKLWGFILSKVSMQLPGGGNFNGEKIEQQGITEIEQVEEEIRKTSEPIDFYIA